MKSVNEIIRPSHSKTRLIMFYHLTHTQTNTHINVRPCGLSQGEEAMVDV